MLDEFTIKIWKCYVTDLGISALALAPACRLCHRPAWPGLWWWLPVRRSFPFPGRPRWSCRSSLQTGSPGSGAKSCASLSPRQPRIWSQRGNINIKANTLSRILSQKANSTKMIYCVNTNWCSHLNMVLSSDAWSAVDPLRELTVCEAAGSERYSPGKSPRESTDPSSISSSTSDYQPKTWSPIYFMNSFF